MTCLQLFPKVLKGNRQKNAHWFRRFGWCWYLQESGIRILFFFQNWRNTWIQLFPDPYKSIYGLEYKYISFFAIKYEYNYPVGDTYVSPRWWQMTDMPTQPHKRHSFPSQPQNKGLPSVGYAFAFIAYSLFLWTWAKPLRSKKNEGHFQSIDAHDPFQGYHSYPTSLVGLGKSDHRRLSSGCLKCLESTIMSCSIKNRPEGLYKQAKVALDSYRTWCGKSLLQQMYMAVSTDRIFKAFHSQTLLNPPHLIHANGHTQTQSSNKLQYIEGYETTIFITHIKPECEPFIILVVIG